MFAFSPLLSSLLSSLSCQTYTCYIQMNSGVLENLRFFGSVHAGGFLDQWVIMTFWNPFVSHFKTASLFTTFLSLKPSGLSTLPCNFLWLLLKTVNFLQQGMCIKKKSAKDSSLQLGLVTLLRFQVGEGLLKVILLWPTCHLLYHQRRGLEPMSYNSVVSVPSFTSHCFQSRQHSLHIPH